MKRVLVIADFDATGGTGTYLKRVLPYLAARYEVRLVLHDRQRKNPLLSYIMLLGISVSYDYVLFPKLDSFFNRAFRRLGLSLFYLFARDTLSRFRLELRHRPTSIFISQGGGCNYFAFLLSRLPCVIVTHSLFTTPIIQTKGYRLYLWLYRGIDRRTKRICSVSKYAGDLFCKHILSQPLSDISMVIPNYGSDPVGSRRERSDCLTVLTMGHVISYKNPETWLVVATNLTHRYPGRVRFLWAGAGDSLRVMRQQSTGLQDISFVGFVDEPNRLYEEADIYFQPSVWESQGISVVEAMAYGLPCVVSSAGGLPESVEDGLNGFIRDPYDTSGFTDAIAELIDSPEKRAWLGQNGIVKFLAEFTKERWESRMDEVIGTIMGNGS